MKSPHPLPVTEIRRSDTRPAAAEPSGRQPLSRALKYATRDLHSRAEHTGIVAEILAQRVTLEGYRCYLQNLLPVYETLERRIAGWRDDPLLAPICDPNLMRCESIKNDLSNLPEGSPAGGCGCLSSCRNYQGAIDNATVEGLVAHAYVRYLGDLNGGRIVAGLIRRTLELGARETAFYEFPGLPSIARAASDFRRALDAAGSCLRADEVIAAAKEAFCLNIQLADEVLRCSDRLAVSQ